MSPERSAVRGRRRMVLTALALGLTAAGWAPGRLAAQQLQSPHGALSADVDCSGCHTPDAWTPARAVLEFDHDAQTLFPLAGPHARTECESCHLALDFSAPKVGGAGCVACHFDVHQGNLGADCVRCHTSDSFLDVPGVDVHANTLFPLTGAHLQVSCDACHLDDRRGAFSGRDTDCMSCHLADYQATRRPSHAEQGFSSDCQQCHGTVAWTNGTTFAHDRASGGFPLLGAHLRVACASCHIDGINEVRFTAAGAEDCVACHQADYDLAHSGTDFSTQCTDCHTPDRWQGSDFDHVQVSGGFDLIGAHETAVCSSCHSLPGNEVPWTPAGESDCVACHRVDYDQEHAGTSFSTLCTDCHTVDTWLGATFEHDALYFPIYSGRHQSVWQNDCTTCHTTPNDFSQFTCLQCHEHRQSKMDDEHSGVSGYVYDSKSCLSCHPTGSD